MNFTHPPGSTPLDRYTIRRGIGVGGFGEVYFAVSEGGKEVALKQIQRNWDVELRGAGHCLNLKHPNLVSLHDVTRDSAGHWWIVMEYIAGANLRDVLNHSPSGLSAAEVHRWFTGVCRGVAHLHSAGLVHRDLKPGNLFDDSGVVKVGDYGLSKFISHTHRGGHTESVGTFHYMAPEVGRGEYGTGVDVYALGVILYEVLLGDVPFDGESQHEIIMKHLSDQPDVSRLDEPYRSLVERCLEKDPRQRFTDAGELLSAWRMALRSNGETSDLHDDVDPFVSPTSWKSQTEPSVDGRSVDGATSKRSPDRGSSSQESANRDPAAATEYLRDEEPIARAIRHSMADFGRWWHSLDRSPASKLIFVVVALAIAGIHLPWWIWVATALACTYLPYYVVRNVVRQVKMQPVYEQRQREAMRIAAERPMTRSQWRTAMRRDLSAIPSLRRLSQLNTSTVVAVICTTVVTALAAVFGMRDGTVDAQRIAPYAAAGMTTLVASVGMLILGRYWERDEGDAVTRRLAAGGVGALVGSAAAASREFLLLPSDRGLVRDIDATGVPQLLYSDGNVTGAAMVVYFALLFALLRTWRPVDPLRRKRFSVWSIAVAAIAAWGVHQLVPIPQPFGMLVAAASAAVVQVAAPWVHPQTPPRRIESERFEVVEDAAMKQRSLI